MDSERVNELEDDLHAVADAVKADAQALQAIEERKTETSGDHRRLASLSKQALELAGEIAAKTRIEAGLARELRGSSD